MKIVDRKEFKTLPEGTIYSEYEPCFFTGLFRKGKAWDDDYFESNLIAPVMCSDSCEYAEVLTRAEETKNSFKLDFDVECRNGMFTQDQLYAIYEDEDITKLIKTLYRGIGR